MKHTKGRNTTQSARGIIERPDLISGRIGLARLTEQCVIAIYDTLLQAEEAVCTLDQGGLPMTQVSVVGRDLKQEHQQDHFTVAEAAKQGAITGASIGGLFGLLINVASVWVPGFGPLLVAGPIALALLGGIEGAIAGAVGAELLSAMSGHTVSEQDLTKYNEALKHGNCLVIVTGTTNDIGQAHHLLEQTRTTGLKVHNEAVG